MKGKIVVRIHNELLIKKAPEFKTFIILVLFLITAHQAFSKFPHNPLLPVHKDKHFHRQLSYSFSQNSQSRFSSFLPTVLLQYREPASLSYQPLCRAVIQPLQDFLCGSLVRFQSSLE